MPDLIYRPAAIEDLDAIFDYIAADNPERAIGFLAKIRDRCRSLARFPKSGRARNDLGKDVRVLQIDGRVVAAYRIEQDAVVILRVFYGGRDYEAILLKDP